VTMHLQVLLTLSAGVLAAGTTCSEIYELSEDTCGEDMTAACLEDSQCQNLIAQGLETCTEEDMVYDEEAGHYTSALAGLREAEAGVRFACNPCGGAFMQFMMMVMDASVCGEENIMSVCQAGTLCHGAMQNVTNMCTNEDTFFDDENVLDTIGEFSLLCSPCGMAYGGVVESCVDDDTQCDEGGPCQTALDTLRSTCTDEDVLPGMDESESLDDIVWYFDWKCASMPEPKCVELPRQHPIWSSLEAAGLKPRECNVMN